MLDRHEVGGSNPPILTTFQAFSSFAVNQKVNQTLHLFRFNDPIIFQAAENISEDLNSLFFCFRFDCDLVVRIPSVLKDVFFHFGIF